MSNKSEWDRSYDKQDNFVFYPHEEVIRFVSKFIRKRVGIDSFRDVAAKASHCRVLDLGCGIGRHVMYCHEMGLQAYGIDLSDSAIRVAHDWAERVKLPEPTQRIRQGDVRQLPWENGFFSHAVSHGVLDSMPFEIARAACLEMGRVLQPGALFYCDLISGDDSKHAREFSGEEVVTSAHEQGTIQLYFNMEKIRSMVDGVFSIEECHLIRRENTLQGGYTSRHHVVLKRS